MNEKTKTWLIILVAIIAIPTIIYLPEGYEVFGVCCIILMDIIKNRDIDKKVNAKEFLNPMRKTWVQNGWIVCAAAWIIAIFAKAPKYILMPLCFVNMMFLLYDMYHRHKQ